MNHRGGVPMANLTDSGPPATPHRQLLPSLFWTFKAFYLLNYRALIGAGGIRTRITSVKLLHIKTF